MILFTRPDHDSLTNYLKIWSDDLIKIAKGLGVSLVDLIGKKASKINFSGYLNNGTNKNFICLNGHGNEYIVCGFNDERLLSEDDFKKNKKVNVIYARSCKVGQFLGKIMVKSGVKAFVGYDENFVVYMKSNCVLKPLRDDLAKKFIEPSNHLIYQLLKNKTVSEADEKSKSMMKREIIGLLSSGNNDDLNIATYLYSNLVHQIVIGDKSSRIFT